MNDVEISVVICSHNPRAEPLRRALTSLSRQTLPKTKWELLLVDNASAWPLSEAFDFSCQETHARHVREEQLGLTWARLRGITESTGAVIVFLDDDNVVAPDYLEQALQISRSAPHIGAWGAGCLTPEFEVEPPTVLTPLLPMLALRSTAVSAWTNNAKDWSCRPWGAGLCVTRQVAQAYTELLDELKVHEMLGRRGDVQSCGEDDLFSVAAVRVGKGFGIFPELRLTHLIAPGRLTRKYFIRLVHDHALSHGVLAYVLFGELPKQRTATSMARTLLHGLRHGLFSMQCRWAASAGADRAARLIETLGLSYMNPLGTGPVTTAAQPEPAHAPHSILAP